MEERPFFICMISREIMRNPSMLTDGGEVTHKYEFDAITSWLATSNKDPITRKQLGHPVITRDSPLQREIRNWCDDKARSYRKERARAEHIDGSGSASAKRSSVHVFIDHSNVMLGAAQAGRPKLEPANIARFIEGDRTVKERMLVGSNMGGQLKHKWEQMKYAVMNDPRSGPECFVDEALHAQVQKTASKRFGYRGVIALATGDGNANRGRATFPDCVMLALENDWHVELYSWHASTSQVYLNLLREYSSVFSIRYFDEM
jgi:hypothetical protein